MDLETAISANTKFLRFFSNCFGFPFEVDMETKRLRSIKSPWRLAYLHLVLTVLIAKTFWAFGTLTLCFTHKDFYNQGQLPIHFTQTCGFIACTGWVYLLLVKHRTLFIIHWNGLMERRSLVTERKFKYFLLTWFPYTFWGGFFTFNICQALDPTWPQRFRFGAQVLQQFGFLQQGWAFFLATAVTLVLDSLALMSAANVVVLVWFTHVCFFEVWIAAIDHLTRGTSQCSHIDWSKVTEVVLLLRYFNLSNSTSIFLTKALNMTLGITTYAALIIMTFEQWYVTAFLVYIAIVNLTGYPFLYSEAFKISSRLEDLKKRAQRSTSAGLADRQVAALSTRGVSVGAFRTFEQESVLLFVDFIVRQGITIVLAYGLIKGPNHPGRGYTPTSDAYLIKEDKEDAMAKLEFSIVPVERASDVAELLLSSFFKDEPLGIALGLPVSQASRWLPAYIKEAVKEGMSWMAVDTETDKLVGASINVVKHADPAANTLHMPDYIDTLTEPTMCTIAKFLGHLSSDVQIPGNPDRALSILFLNVESHYGGRGIAQDLTRRSEQHAVSSGINTFVVDTTSEFSYKVYKKLGYQTLTELAYADYVDEGVQILQGKEMEPHTHARVLAKSIV